MEEGTRIPLPPPVLVGGGGGDEQDIGEEPITLGSNLNKSESSSRSGTVSKSSGNASPSHSHLEQDANSVLRASLRRQESMQSDVLGSSAPMIGTPNALLLATIRQQRQQSPPRSDNEPIRPYNYQNHHEQSSSRYRTPDYADVTIERVNNTAPERTGGFLDGIGPASAASTPSPHNTAALRHHRSNTNLAMYDDQSTNGEDLAATTTASLSFSHSHAVSTDDSYGEVFHFVNSAHALGWRVENTSTSSNTQPAIASQTKSRDTARARGETGRSLSLRPPSAAVAEINVHLMQQIADRFETTRARK